MLLIKRKKLWEKGKQLAQGQTEVPRHTKQRQFLYWRHGD
jgi:hypothetical protein